MHTTYRKVVVMPRLLVIGHNLLNPHLNQIYNAFIKLAFYCVAYIIMNDNDMCFLLFLVATW